MKLTMERIKPETKNTLQRPNTILSTQLNSNIYFIDIQLVVTNYLEFYWKFAIHT